jgi:hypothetical protein
VAFQVSCYIRGVLGKPVLTYATKYDASSMCLKRGYAQSFYLAQKSNQNTWFSATLDFSLVFRWFSAFSPTLCTVISKKTKLSCFGGFFSWFLKSKQLLGFLGVVYMMKQGPNRNILFKKYYQS